MLWTMSTAVLPELFAFSFEKKTQRLKFLALAHQAPRAAVRVKHLLWDTSSEKQFLHGEMWALDCFLRDHQHGQEVEYSEMVS